MSSSKTTTGDSRHNKLPDISSVGQVSLEHSENPLRWSTCYRSFLVGVITCVVFTTSIASSVVAPAVPQILREFNSIDQVLGTFIVTIELLGACIGPTLMGPLSEVLGRRIIYNFANMGFSLSSLGCALAPSLPVVIFMRFLQGCFASCCQTTAGGTISDLVPIHRRGFAMSMYSVGFLLGPAIGPIVGSYVTAVARWRWIFFLLLILNATMGLLCALTYPETYTPVLLEWKMKKFNHQTSIALLGTDQGQLSTQQRAYSTVLKRAIIKPIKMLLFCPVVMGLAIYNAVVYGFNYLLFATFSAVFEEQYQFDQETIGLAYLGLAIGFLVSLGLVSVVNDRTHLYLTKKHGGLAKPEYRLDSLIYGAIAIPIGFLLYGWTIERHAHPAVPITATGLVGFGVMFTFIPFNVYMIDAYTIYAASAIAAGNILRSLSGAFLPLVGIPLYSTLGYGWGNTLLAMLSLGLVGLCIVLRIYGEMWRKRYTIEFY